MTVSKIKKLLIITAALCAVALAAAVGLWPKCLFLNRLGIPCLTCGMTRSFLALVRLDWRTSLLYHPLTVPFALTLWLMLARDTLGIGERALSRWVVVLSGLLVLFWLYRMSGGTERWAFLLG